jgi:hypothetical protein
VTSSAISTPAASPHCFPLSDPAPYALAATGDGLVAALRDGRLFISDEKGESWRPLEADGLTKVVAMAA